MNKLKKYLVNFIVFIIFTSFYFLSLINFTIIVLVVSIGLAFKYYAENGPEAKKRNLLREEDLARSEEFKKSQIEIQQAHLRHIAWISNAALTAFESLPVQLMEAEQRLDQSEVDYSDGAFSPFWDCIEAVVRVLSEFDKNIKCINQLALTFKEATNGVDSPLRFPIQSNSVLGIECAKATTIRWREIVRTAQCNFHFATIFEQRRTNQLLESGFRNLAQAIDGMGEKISISIDGLIGSIENLESTVKESSEKLQGSMEELNSFMKIAEAAKVERSAKVLTMLDNIQRRRLPLAPSLRDHQY